MRATISLFHGVAIVWYRSLSSSCCVRASIEGSLTVSISQGLVLIPDHDSASKVLCHGDSVLAASNLVVDVVIALSEAWGLLEVGTVFPTHILKSGDEVIELQ